MSGAPAVPASHDALFAELGQRRRRAGLLVAVTAAIVLGFSWYAGILDAARLGEGLPAIAKLVFQEGFPPDFERFPQWLGPVADTLAMSVAGTALALVLSFGLGFLAARNTTPHPAVYVAARGVLNLLRSIPELILGILFVAAVGFGILPGVLALGLHSVGMVGKFFAEAVEHADPAPAEAARAAGATPLQVLVHGLLPQVLPQMADVAVYRWEFNFRASAVMGMVGCGGIGFQLMSSLSLMDYRQVTAILIVVLACVTAVDAIGARVRREFA